MAQTDLFGTPATQKSKVRGRTAEEGRIYQRQWRAANPEKAKEYERRYRLANRERYKALIAAWFKANPDIQKGYHLKKHYGITLAEKTAMILAQEGRCGICGATEPGTKLGWSVDADHSISPARIRGILCKNCNTALGVFKHSEELLRKAIVWLRR